LNASFAFRILHVLQVFPYPECGLCAAGCGCDRLPVDGVGYVSCHENPGHFGFDLVLSDYIPLFIKLELSLEEFGVGLVPYRNKYAINLKR
jgi:hypothetical protein